MAWPVRRFFGGSWLVALLLLFSGLSSRAAAYCQLTTEAPASGECVDEGLGLAWGRQCISYTLVPMRSGSLPIEEVRRAIDRSFAAWTDVDCGDRPLPLKLGRTEELGACLHAEYNRFGPNANTIMFLDEWEGADFPPTAYGLTLVWHDPTTGRILDADMQINETLGPIAICGNECRADWVDLENVVTHEAGHFLGLGHSLVAGSTMIANAGLGEITNRSLELDDHAGICSIYTTFPTPSCNDTAFQPDHGFTAMCGEPMTSSDGCAATVVGAQRHGTRTRTRNSQLEGLGIFALALTALALVRRRR